MSSPSPALVETDDCVRVDTFKTVPRVVRFIQKVSCERKKKWEENKDVNFLTLNQERLIANYCPRWTFSLENIFLGFLFHRRCSAPAECSCQSLSKSILRFSSRAHPWMAEIQKHFKNFKYQDGRWENVPNKMPSTRYCAWRSLFQCTKRFGTLLEFCCKVSPASVERSGRLFICMRAEVLRYTGDMCTDDACRRSRHRPTTGYRHHCVSVPRGHEGSQIRPPQKYLDSMLN